jgi:hypothetical protein
VGDVIMDAGQSGVRLRLDGVPLPEQPGVRTNAPVLPQVAAALRQALTDAGARATTLAVGSTALPATARAGDLLRLTADLGIVHVGLAHDSITS